MLTNADRRSASESDLLSPPLQQEDRTYVRVGRKKLSYFGGCDYFRLASHPLILKALKEGLHNYGLNVAASRLTTGNHELYQRLEERLAGFFGAEGAVLVGAGYLSNLAVAQALAGSFSHALIDERAHPSLVDAAELLDCPTVRFKHRDAQDVGKIVQRIGRAARPLLLTDGMFSHDGSTAPLRDYLRVLPSDGLLLVDDAHGAGVLGKTGQGTVEHLGLNRRQVVQTTALSKAFGVYGGAILCRERLRRAIQARSRIFQGSTPFPLPLAGALLKSCDLLSVKGLRTRLFANIKRVKTALQKMGYHGSNTPGPIVQLIPSAGEVTQCQRLVLANDIFPSFIKYPGGPTQGYFRFALSSEHSVAQVNSLIEVFWEMRASSKITLSQS